MAGFTSVVTGRIFTRRKRPSALASIASTASRSITELSLTDKSLEGRQNMLTTSDWLRIELDGAPWTVVKTTTQTPSARRCHLGQSPAEKRFDRSVSDCSFKSGDKFVEPDLQMRAAQYLYSEPDGADTIYHFMDGTNYEQFKYAIMISRMKSWLTENLEVKLCSTTTLSSVLNSSIR